MGRVFVNVWAMEYLCGTVGVLNALEISKQTPHTSLMEVLQASDHTEDFQKTEWNPSRTAVQHASVNGRPGRSEQMTPM